jgi:hypothetical protein
MARTTNPITPGQRSQRARAASAARWSRLPADQRAAQTAKARAAIPAKYLRQIDPDGVLPEAEREKLARQARHADLQRWSLMASRARSAKAAYRAPEGGTYLSRLPAPGAIPAGQVVVHNDVKPANRMGPHGFRAWLQAPTGRLEPCDCGWAPRLGAHYRVRQPAEAAE